MTVAECLLTMAVGYRYAGLEYGGSVSFATPKKSVWY
jgi:hypothetical protein